MSRLTEYLKDPILLAMWQKIRAAGAIKSISLDLTHECNLRCDGCYYYGEGMDDIQPPKGHSALDKFILDEKKRGTNFVTIVGGEPSLELSRLKKIYDNFKTNVATNGIIRIPYEGFESLPIGVAIWGNHQTDSELRNKGKRDLFEIAKINYKNDPRAFWYYTVSPDHAHEIGPVVEECLENGNRVLFNYFSDINAVNNAQDHSYVFQGVEKEINKMIHRYPGKIWMTPYFNRVISRGELFEEKWGYEVCTNLSSNLASNQERFDNGNPYNPHFRAYNADFKTTRRCCTGIQRECGSCYDTWEHFSWIMINLRKHLGSQSDFRNWLQIVFLFYLINRLIDPDEGIALFHRARSESIPSNVVG